MEVLNGGAFWAITCDDECIICDEFSIFCALNESIANEFSNGFVYLVFRCNCSKGSVNFFGVILNLFKLKSIFDINI